MKILFSALIILFQGYVTIINDDFAYRPFENEIQMKSMNELFELDFEVSFETKQNKHSLGEDTIFTYQYNESYFEFIKIPTGKVFFSQAKLKDDVFDLKGISIGMEKEQFDDYFKVNLSIDSIVLVTDSEDLVGHSFFFNGNKLSQININMYLD